MNARFSKFLLTIVFMSIAAHASAFELTDGSYDTANDGARGTLTIKNGFASLGVSSGSCLGEIEGQIVDNGESGWSFSQSDANASCTISLEPTVDGLAWISSGQGCSYYHGATCGFSGLVKQRAIAFSIAAVDAGFMQFSETDRKAIQSAMTVAGYYGGKIDGQTGPATREAIHNAAKATVASGGDIGLDDQAVVHEYLNGMIAVAVAEVQAVGEVPLEAVETPVLAITAAPEASSIKESYLGRWSCVSKAMGAMTFNFEGEVATIEEMGRTTKYKQVRSIGESGAAYLFTFMDGVSLVAIDVQSDAMVLILNGDLLQCSKL